MGLWCSQVLLNFSKTWDSRISKCKMKVWKCMLTENKISQFFGNGADSSEVRLFEDIYSPWRISLSAREWMRRERETIRVKWPKFSQQISLTKIQSRAVAIEGCIVGPWKMAVGNNRITLALVGTRWGRGGGEIERDEEVGETGK